MVPAIALAADEQPAAGQAEVAEATKDASVISSDVVVAAEAVDGGIAADAAAEATGEGDAKNVVLQEIEGDVGIVNGDVALTQGAPSAGTLLTQDGLNFALNPDGATLAVVGWSGAAPEGDLAIPAAVQVGGELLPVTEMSLGGGGQ